jgi:hypothetical protein
MVIQYKCKCNCTSIEQLNFNGRDICKKRIQNEIIHDLQPDNIEYIQKIQIVTKKITVRRMGIEKPFTLKTIEFLLDRELDELEFLEFIHKLKDVGFSSSIEKSPIQFINTSTLPITIMFDYNFSTEVANEPEIHRRERSRRSGQNRSSYKTLEIYKRV